MHELILTMLEFKVVCPVTSQPSFIVCICHDRAISCSAITSGQIQSEEEIGPSLSLTHSSFQISDPRQDKRLITAGTCPILPRWLPHPLRENTLCVPSAACACLGNYQFRSCPLCGAGMLQHLLSILPHSSPGIFLTARKHPNHATKLPNSIILHVGPHKSGCGDKSFWSTLLSAEV